MRGREQKSAAYERPPVEGVPNSNGARELEHYERSHHQVDAGLSKQPAREVVERLKRSWLLHLLESGRIVLRGLGLLGLAGRAVLAYRVLLRDTLLNDEVMAKDRPEDSCGFNYDR